MLLWISDVLRRKVWQRQMLEGSGGEARVLRLWDKDMVIDCQFIAREEVASGKTVLSKDATFGVETCFLGRRQTALYETNYIDICGISGERDQGLQSRWS